MIVALLNQKGGVGKTTLSLHLAAAFEANGARVLLVDADPQGSALDWAETREREGHARRFGIVALPRETLHREAADLARSVDHIVIDGPPRTAGITRSALLAADLVLIPAQPSPFDGWASAEMVRQLDEARVFKPALPARFVLNRCGARTRIARDIAGALDEAEPRRLTATIGQRVAFAEAARSGRLVDELDGGAAAAREIAAFAAEVREIAP